MKFNNVNEMVSFANAMPRTQKGDHSIPRTTPAFRVAYIDLCRKNNVVVSEYAHLINVAPTTPYSWLNEYDINVGLAGKTVNQDETNVVAMRRTTDMERVLKLEIESLERALQETKDELYCLQQLTARGYSITKE
jgi:transposase-like protein